MKPQIGDIVRTKWRGEGRIIAIRGKSARIKWDRGYETYLRLSWFEKATLITGKTGYTYQ